MKASKERLAKAAKRADELMAEMTLQQKVGQLSQFGRSIYGGVEAYYEDHYPEGKIGSYLSISGAAKLNRIQKRLVEETPHHIPALFAYDVIHGYKTTMPTPLTQSMSWEPRIAKNGAEVAAKEASAAGIRWTFAPMVDIARDPRWGRIMEGYGEDPYLCSRFAEATVDGFQGDELGQKDHVMACAKHFVTYGACIGGRDYNSADMSLQTLYDTYLPSFKAAFDAGAASCMPAFNDFNGVPCTCNRFLLQDVLRKELGFDGVTISDAGAVVELIPHNVCDNEKDAVDLAFNAGIDIIMAFDPYNNNLPKLLEEGKVKLADIDAACKRVLMLKDLMGLFDEPLVDEAREECFFAPEHLAVARDAAKRSLVLMKNEGRPLPIAEGKKIALIGPLADAKRDVLGGWAGVCDPEKTVTVLQGLQERFGAENVQYVKGCEIEGDDESGFAEAVRAASEADIAVLVVGESVQMSGEANCRSDIRLPGVQEALVQAVAACGKPVAVLISSGRPLATAAWKDLVPCVMFIGQPGTECGHAVADVLSGDYNPSGRLTCTFPLTVGQIPCYYNALNTGRPALGKVSFEAKYRDLPIEPAFPFGHGLSYTEFTYDNLQLSAAEMTADGAIEISVDVKNTGACDGEDVVELYVRDMIGSRARPMKELKGFRKLFLKKGETETVRFTLKGDDLAFRNWKLERVTEPGDFKVWISRSSADPVLEGDFRVIEK